MTATPDIHNSLVRQWECSAPSCRFDTGRMRHTVPPPPKKYNGRKRKETRVTGVLPPKGIIDRQWSSEEINMPMCRKQGQGQKEGKKRGFLETVI